MNHSLTCNQLVELVTAYLDDALSHADRVAFEAHIHECEGCKNFVAQMRATIGLVGRLTGDDIDPLVSETLLEAFRDFHRQS